MNAHYLQKMFKLNQSVTGLDLHFLLLNLDTINVIINAVSADKLESLTISFCNLDIY